MAEPAVPRRNVEFKARDHDPQRSLRPALAAGTQHAGVLEQTDTYFHAARGRLKLRGQTVERLKIDPRQVVSFSYSDAVMESTLQA